MKGEFNMAVNEQIVTGRKFRKLVDEATKLWQRISFWTKAVDVEFNDSKTAETKLGAIDGITDSLVSTSSRIAASAKAVNELNNKLMESFQVGCNAIVNKLKELGVTPESNSPDDIVKAIETVYNNRYDEGISSVNKCSGGRYYICWVPNTVTTNVKIWHNGQLVCDRNYNPGSTQLTGNF